MHDESSSSRVNPFARLGAGEIFAINVIGFYGTGALIRDLLGAMDIQYLADGGLGWRMVGAVSYAVAAHYWAGRGRNADRAPSRPVV